MREREREKRDIYSEIQCKIDREQILNNCADRKREREKEGEREVTEMHTQINEMTTCK